MPADLSPAKPVHGVAGLGMTFCGRKLPASRKFWTGDPDEVTCPRCKAVLGGK